MSLLFPPGFNEIVVLRTLVLPGLDEECNGCYERILRPRFLDISIALVIELCEFCTVFWFLSTGRS